MKSKSINIVTCSITDQEIEGRSALVLYGKIVRLDKDGKEAEVVFASTDPSGDAVLQSALISKIRGEAVSKGPRTQVVHATAAEVIAALREINQPAVSTAALCEKLGKKSNAVRRGIAAAEKDGAHGYKLVKVTKGAYAVKKAEAKAA